MTAIMNYPLTNAFGLISELRRRNPVLAALAAAHLALFLVMLIIAPFDHRLVMGINPWIKPMKFAISITIYLVTIAWFLYYLPISGRAQKIVTWATALVMVVEMALIAFQAARGTTSHFNVSSAFNSAIFSIMGLAITVNTLVAAYLAIKFWQMQPLLPAPYLWGIRLGLIIFVLASLEGFVMVAQLSHSVGVADGGPGLPFVNWSTRGGDLRIAHFFGMHALQALPFIGYLLSQPSMSERLRHPVLWLWATAAGYVAIALLLFLQARAGRPLLGI
jgi:hypothetical protein